MKPAFKTLKHVFACSLAFLLVPFVAQAENRVTTVTQIAGNAVINEDLDLHVSGETPFADGAVVDFQNTEHAVLILDNVKPSAAIKLLAQHVTIGGTKATNNTNCQVKLYNRGSIILPYGNSVKPLTVYSEKNFEGTAVNSFGLENDGGFMNTLTAAKLNNQIRSFKLKRGYMVTFSTQAKGRGYSRCFIAADEDLEIASLPVVLDQKITSYRIFKWYDTGKAALANNTSSSAVSALNVTSCYSFGLGESRLPDAECVPHRIHEGWPGIDACGKVDYSPHLKTNNEPRNSSDDSPATLAQILANWEALMATGKRLCSPSSWDGSDYVSNAGGFLREFFDSIDARGWRCDIIDLHCYWAEGTFNSMHNWVDALHRPIWISEWVWGASWNGNGAFANGVTEAQNAAAIRRICNNMNNWSYVERYFYWNSERDPSKILKGSTLTEAGKYYASINSGLGYNGKYDYVPRSPRQADPDAFSVQLDLGKATLKWTDYNGEYNQLMTIERSLDGKNWEVIATPEQKETRASYTYVDEQDVEEGMVYRIHVVDLNGRDRYTEAITAGTPVYRRTMESAGWGTICLPYLMVPTEGITLYSIVGITPDFLQLCLEPVSETKAGQPYVYYSEVTEVKFKEYGDAVARASSVNGFYGSFVNYNVRTGYYILKDGQWYRLTAREPIQAYEAFLRSALSLPVLENWTGVTMPIAGVADEQQEAGVHSVVVSPTAADKAYDLGGRPASKRNPLRIVNGQKQVSTRR